MMVTNMMSLTKAKIIIVSKAFMKSHDVDVDKDRTKVMWKADVKDQHMQQQQIFAVDIDTDGIRIR